ncbi:MAG: glycoside hydrolase [Acidobacteriia bacterium]|nr:glycoside hydrolase [Terriglobia bacterium]
MFLLLASAFVPLASAQQQDGPGAAPFRAAIALEQKVTPNVRDFFSGALQNFLATGHALLDQPSAGPDSGLKQGSQTRLRAGRFASLSSGRRSGRLDRDRDSRTVQISDPGRDFQFSQVGGFTQNTSSSAWCGHNVVTGFFSSTGVVDTLFEPEANGLLTGASFIGTGISHNDGKSFVDRGFVPPGDFPNSLVGNPVLACSSADRFYLATSFQTGIVDPNDPFAFSPLSGIAISLSNDGGRSWNAPLPAILKDGSFHFLDKGWLAVDPLNRNRLYVSYTDFDLEGLSGDLFPAARCPGNFRTAIEMVSSMNGGQTWSTPSIVHEDCIPDGGSASLATGSQVAVGHDGQVYISYDVFPIGNDAGSRSVRLAFRRSSTRGQSFAAETTVDTITLSANGGARFDDFSLVFNAFLQGFFRNTPYPSMAVDTSRNGHDTIYIVWSDGRDNSTVELIATDGLYHFSDILLSSSSDGGTTWSKSAPVSPTPPDFRGAGRDQFQPGIAVDPDGNIAVCYYDRRNDPVNNAVDRYCSLSRNHGRTFRDVRQTAASWIPTKATDFLLSDTFLGDYDALAAHLESRRDDDSGTFFDSFQVIKNVVPSVRGRRLGRDQ